MIVDGQVDFFCDTACAYAFIGNSHKIDVNYKMKYQCVSSDEELNIQLTTRKIFPLTINRKVP